MILEFAVISSFASLLLASIYDVRSMKGDVPEYVLYSGVILGLGLHLVLSVLTSNFTPFVYSLVAGIGSFIYGYGAYWKGMWGEADALGLVILGVSTPYFLGAVGLIDLLVNLMLVGFIYAVLFGMFKGLKSREVREDFLERLTERRKVLIILVLLISGFSVFSHFNGMNGAVIFSLFSAMLLVFFFMKSVEEKAMMKTVKADQVEVGDVLAEGEIRGVSEEELKELEGDVKLKEGLRFMPVFPVALLLTLTSVSGLQLLILIF